jgi:hypothetical protein
MSLVLRAATIAPGVLLPLLAAGCSPASVLNENVQGTLKMDGKPVANVRVEFWPQLGAEHRAPSSAGVTDEKGAYRLTCENGKPGAVIARHKVVLLQGRAAATPDEKADDTAPRKSGPAIPVAYTIASQTPLEVNVKTGESTYDLTVKQN